MRWLWTLLAVTGCGDDLVPPFTPGCEDTPQLGRDAFGKPADFGGKVEPGTLAHWDADGRWFYTGTDFDNVSSLHVARHGHVAIVDRDTDHPGSIDDDVLFQRWTDDTFIVATLVSNRDADGSLRGERVVCNGETCRHCTGKLVRAAHRAGEGEGDKLSLVGELRGDDWRFMALNVRVAGTIAYVVLQDELRIVETADPARPVELGHFQLGPFVNDIKLVEANGTRYAIIANTPVDVLDLTYPTAPTFVGQIAEEAHTLFTETRDGKTLAYFGDLDGTCPVYDVTNPAAPVLLGRFDAKSTYVHDLSVVNHIAYLNAWEQGLIVVDFTDPAHPKELGRWSRTPIGTSHSNWTTTAGGRHIALHGDEGYGAHLDVVDVDPASPTFMQPFASWKTRDFVSIHNIMAFDTKAYFTYYQDGVRVLDVSDPAAPTQVGYYNTWDPQGDGSTNAFFEGAIGLDVDRARGLVFVADVRRGLVILRDETP